MAVLLMAMLVAITATASYAQTPDGETPAEEDVCDPLAGAAFGLCNAYCEAMDCHLPDAAHPDAVPNASPTACLKVKDNFIKITGMTELPCEAAACPVGTESCACNLDEPECDPGLVCDVEVDPPICVVDDGGQS
ncbi:MAG: hypothetical protein ACE5EG_02705 [Thermoanaerobaculia bacterium]